MLPYDDPVVRFKPAAVGWQFVHAGVLVLKMFCTSVAKLIGVALTFATRVPDAGPAVAVIVAAPATANVVSTVESSVAVAAGLASDESLEVHTTLSSRAGWSSESKTRAKNGADWLVVIVTSGVPKFAGEITTVFGT
jgi:hypothetical protein